MAMTNFVRSKMPHVIVIGSELREVLMVQADLREILKKFNEEEQFPNVALEIIDNDLSKIYANSNKGIADFREYPTRIFEQPDNH